MKQMNKFLWLSFRGAILPWIFSTVAYAGTHNLGMGSASFDDFVSAGALTSFARDAGGLFVNPAALSRDDVYFLSHSFAGYSRFSTGTFQAQNASSALGFVWWPQAWEGRFVVAGGYYNPDGMEVNQNFEPSALPGFSSSYWHLYARGEAFARRAGLSVSYEQSSAWNWGLTLSATSAESDMKFETGADQTAEFPTPSGNGKIEYQGFSSFRLLEKSTTLEAILGSQVRLAGRFLVGMAVEAPFVVLGNTKESKSTGLSVTKMEIQPGSPETTVSKSPWGYSHKSRSPGCFPVQYRAGGAWHGESVLLAFDVSHRSAFRDLEDEKYKSVTNWALSVRHEPVRNFSLQVGLRTNYNAVLEDDKRAGEGALDARAGLTLRVGNTEFGAGGAYTRMAKGDILDPSAPEQGRVLQAFVGMNSYFL